MARKRRTYKLKTVEVVDWDGSKVEQFAFDFESDIPAELEPPDPPLCSLCEFPKWPVEEGIQSTLFDLLEEETFIGSGENHERARTA